MSVANDRPKPISSQDPRRIDPALREKYDVRGPRYTSYPPANHFKPLAAEEVFARWRERNRLADDPGLSLYLHIPFCRKRCLFCGCHTFATTRPEKMGDYTRRLIGEMRLAAGIVDPSRAVRQVALGGGTPNALDERKLESVLDALGSIYTIAPGAELSVEINPRTATPAKLDVFLSHGFNRFSLGIQDFTPDVLAIVKRDQGLMEVDGVVTHLRAAGVKSINFDLIYGLPGQTLESCLATAEKVITLAPTRIALYSYAHVPWVHAHQQVLERIGLPEPALKASFFLSMMDRFIAAGYMPIGMDHFALPDDPLAEALARRSLRRNFMGYTAGRGLDLLAFGASAISSIGTAYSQDNKDLAEYAAALDEGRLPISRGFLLDLDDQIRRELILELFCNFHADLDSLSEQFGITAADYLAEDLERMSGLAADDLVSWDEHSIDVSDSGRFFIRNICMNFDRYLEHDPGKRIYSRTI